MSGGKKKGGEQSPPVATAKTIETDDKIVERAMSPLWESFFRSDPPVKPSPEFLKEVASWFHEEQGKPWPKTEMVAEFAEYMNARKLYRWGLSEIEKRQKKPKKEDSFKFLKSLDIVERYSKERVEYFFFESVERTKSNLLSRKEIENNLIYWDNLYNSIQKIKNTFEIKFISILMREASRKGRRRDWANAAENILPDIFEIWRQAGRKKPLGNSRTGPLVAVLEKALEFEGFEVDSDAIAKWLESRKKQGKKQRANSSDVGA